MSNLLITLGDSWTSGVGAYEPIIRQMYGNPPIIPENAPKHHYDMLFNYFLKNSWGKLLTEKLKWELINQAAGGMSNPGTAKFFYNNVPNTLNYKRVVVIWMLTDPARLGFFSNKLITNFTPSMGEIYEVCFNKIMFTDEDFFNETCFYLKAMESFCKINNFEFYYASAFSDITPIADLYGRDNLLHGNFKSYKKILKSSDLAPCGHPNETGYKKIADEIHHQMIIRGIV